MLLVLMVYHAMKELFHKKTIQAVHHLPNPAILQIQDHTLLKVCTAQHDSICPFWCPSHHTGITDRLVWQISRWFNTTPVLTSTWSTAGLNTALRRILCHNQPSTHRLLFPSFYQFIPPVKLKWQFSWKLNFHIHAEEGQQILDRGW